jgi:hypothetical protein
MAAPHFSTHGTSLYRHTPSCESNRRIDMIKSHPVQHPQWCRMDTHSLSGSMTLHPGETRLHVHASLGLVLLSHTDVWARVWLERAFNDVARLGFRGVKLGLAREARVAGTPKQAVCELATVYGQSQFVIGRDAVSFKHARAATNLCGWAQRCTHLCSGP